MKLLSVVCSIALYTASGSLIANHATAPQSRLTTSSGSYQALTGSVPQNGMAWLASITTVHYSGGYRVFLGGYHAQMYIRDSALYFTTFSHNGSQYSELEPVSTNPVSTNNDGTTPYLVRVSAYQDQLFVAVSNNTSDGKGHDYNLLTDTITSSWEPKDFGKATSVTTKGIKPFDNGYVQWFGAIGNTEYVVFDTQKSNNTNEQQLIIYRKDQNATRWNQIATFSKSYAYPGLGASYHPLQVVRQGDNEVSLYHIVYPTSIAYIAKLTLYNGNTPPTYQHVTLPATVDHTNLQSIYYDQYTNALLLTVNTDGGKGPDAAYRLNIGSSNWTQVLTVNPLELWQSNIIPSQGNTASYDFFNVPNIASCIMPAGQKATCTDYPTSPEKSLVLSQTDSMFRVGQDAYAASSPTQVFYYKPAQ